MLAVFEIAVPVEGQNAWFRSSLVEKNTVLFPVPVWAMRPMCAL